jgi:hypothetical protein
LLANKALRGGARLQGVCIDPEAADMRVCGYQVDAPELLALRDCDNGLHAIERVRMPDNQEWEEDKEAGYILQPWSRLAWRQLNEVGSGTDTK